MRTIFHIHSAYSFDSILSPEKILNFARHNKINVVAITDHESIEGTIKLQELIDGNEIKDIFVIRGIEVKTSEGDIIGLFIESEVKPGDFMSVVGNIKEQSGLVVLPHPFKNINKIWGKELLTHIDIIETQNSRMSFVANLKAKELAKNFSKPGIIGSDAHTYRELKNAIFELKCINFSENEIKEAICGTKSTIDFKNISRFQNTYSNFVARIKKIVSGTV